jgi:hypothetical protein
MSYRWRCGTPTITNLFLNQNISCLTLTNVQLGTAGVYTVIVTNLGGKASGGPQLSLSSNAFVTVVGPPGNAEVWEGSNITFQARMAGPTNGPGGPPRYQWLFRGSSVASGTNTLASPKTNVNTLTLTNVQPSQAGEYVYLLTDTAGTSTSFPFSLTVLQPPRPLLGCVRAGAELTLSWDAAEFVLLEKSDLSVPGGWKIVSPAGASTVTLPLGPGNKFYRLWKP